VRARREERRSGAEKRGQEEKEEMRRWEGEEFFSYTEVPPILNVQKSRPVVARVSCVRCSCLFVPPHCLPCFLIRGVMDANNILLALQHTYNPQEAKRKEAEDHLKQVSQVFLGTFLSVHNKT
jgi:hypothetical protein